MTNALQKAAIFFGFAEDEGLTQEVQPAAAERAPREELDDRAPVTPLRRIAPQQAADMHEILTVHPRQYRDAQQIATAFRDGTPVIVNLSQMTDGDARRLIDFSAGLTQGLAGRIERVTTKVYLLTPEHIHVTSAADEEHAPQDSSIFAH